MKKIIILSLLIAMVAPVMAQHGKRHDNKQHREISEMVSDLTPLQKRKIENISKDSKERVDALRQQKHAVRDSISMFMDKEGDHSRELYPLFDREARLQVAINREMYTTKIRIDEVLSREQRAALRQTLNQERKRR